MLRLSCERAELADGMRVLDLGCGWGSLSLWIAQHYPNCRVVGVSNSASQRQDVLARAAERGLRNVDVVTADANTFEAPGKFDRVVSVEMMEHTRNWRRLLRTRRRAGSPPRAACSCTCSRTARSATRSRTKVVRTGWRGTSSPAARCPPTRRCCASRTTCRSRRIGASPARTTQRTAEAWLANFDRHRRELQPILEQAYGAEARAMANRWRVFLMACAELWGHDRGREWIVSHYRLRRRA
jgi:cyclopropane-fatty-acyl-phospholipid synthase